MKFSGKGKVKPFPWKEFLRMEMCFTWTFLENEIKKQFFHLVFFNFCIIMIVRILTIMIYHKPAENSEM